MRKKKRNSSVSFDAEFEKIMKTRYTETPKPVMVAKLARFTRDNA